VNTEDWILSHKGYYTRYYTCFCMHLEGNLTKCLSEQKKNLEKEVPEKDGLQGVCTMHFLPYVI